MGSKFTFSRSYDMYLGIFSLVMLLLPKMIAFVFIGFLVFLIIGLKRKKLVFELKFIQVLFALLYLTYVLYALFTRHPDQAGTYIENKLSFLILPILLSFRLKEKKTLQFAISGFVLGVLILISSSLITSSLCYFGPGGGRHCFLASEFSFQHHPSYSAAFYILALALTWYSKRKQFYGFNFWSASIITGFILLASFMSLSLAGILYLFAFIAFYFLYLIYKKFGKWIALVSLLLAPFVMYFTIISIPQVEGEWTNAKWYADEYRKDPTSFVKNRTYPMSGTEVRIVMWTVSSQVFQKYPLGVGTGNVDEVLADHLNKMGQTELAKQNYNPHNQFLQTGIEIGFFGLIVLILILLIALISAIKNRNWILLIISTNLAFNMLFESMLQRQSGIVFYTFWICLLVMYSQQLSTKREVQ